MSDNVSPVDELIARDACEKLLVAGHNNIDEGRAVENAHFYTVDAVLRGGGHQAVGIAEITAVLKQRQEMTDRVTLHALAGFEFHLISPDEAEATGGMMRWLGTAESMDPLPLLQRYRARFVRLDGTWFISEHGATPTSGTAYPA